LSVNTLVVIAHPESGSFNGSWAKATIDACKKLGHTVLVSDLVADNFDPVERASQYPTKKHSPFDPLKAQEQATANGELPADVAIEVEKLRKSDRVIIHFPLWWFGPPAILKGWLDRCLVHGALHTIDERFDNGRCTKKEVLFCVSTGATAHECSYSGKEGDINMLLWPLAYTFRYLGFTVLKPHYAHGVHGYFEGAEKISLENRLKKQIDQHEKMIVQFDQKTKQPKYE